MSANKEKEIYQWFWISVVLKGLISAAEVVAGVAALVIPSSVVINTALAIVHSGIAGPSSGFIARHILTNALTFTADTQAFIAFYLLSRGLIKVFLVVALLKKQLWAYPLSLVVLFLFVMYQMYQIVLTHSLIVIAITLFDLVVMYFIYREYKIIRDQQLRGSV
jgi:uncharacterized membrane protein